MQKSSDFADVGNLSPVALILLRRQGYDLQYGMPCIASALSVESHQDDKGWLLDGFER